MFLELLIFINLQSEHLKIMKILHLNTVDLGDGASRGTYWLHQGLLLKGIDSNILVMRKTSNDPTVISSSRSNLIYKFDRIKNSIDDITLSLYRDRLNNSEGNFFSPSCTSSTGVYRAIKEISPDIIHLHWINKGFLKPESLKQLDVPIVWTLRDMWPLSGGCHYAIECTEYTNSCGKCPLLGSRSENDISRKLWLRKRKSWSSSEINLVAISNWLADCAKSSSLFRDKKIRVIHNALDENKFKPLSKSFSKEALSLNPNKKVIAFGAINALKNKNKGFQYLAKALKKLFDEGFSESFEVVIFGSLEPTEKVDLGFKPTYLGTLRDNIALSLVYSAADVMVVPSIQEAFGKTAIEAMACGTPVVSFDSTGLKDIVDHRLTGYRAQCFDIADLAYGIRWVCEDSERHTKLSRQSRKSVEDRFTTKRQANSYHQLYLELLSASS